MAIGALWGFANLPRDGGTLKNFLEWAGFPWTFAHWVDGRLEWFNPTVLALDILVGVLVGSFGGLACAFARCGWRTKLTFGGPNDTCGPWKPDEQTDERAPE